MWHKPHCYLLPLLALIVPLGFSTDVTTCNYVFRNIHSFSLNDFLKRIFNNRISSLEISIFLISNSQEWSSDFFESNSQESKFVFSKLNVQVSKFDFSKSNSQQLGSNLFKFVAQIYWVYVVMEVSKTRRRGGVCRGAWGPQHQAPSPKTNTADLLDSNGPQSLSPRRVNSQR